MRCSTITCFKAEIRDNEAQAVRPQLISLVHGANNTFLKLCGQPNELRITVDSNSITVETPVFFLRPQTLILFFTVTII